MSSFEACHVCGRMIWRSQPHTCPPAWECAADDDDDSEWQRVYADSEESAACIWLERLHAARAEYEAGRVLVRVRRPGETAHKLFITRMELAPSYTAYPC